MVGPRHPLRPIKRMVDNDGPWPRAADGDAVSGAIDDNWDWKYGQDGIDRLGDADRGNLATGTISSRTFRQDSHPPPPRRAAHTHTSPLPSVSAPEQRDHAPPHLVLRFDNAEDPPRAHNNSALPVHAQQHRTLSRPLPTPPIRSTSAIRSPKPGFRRLAPVRTPAQRRPSGRRRRALLPHFTTPPLDHFCSPLSVLCSLFSSLCSATRPLDHLTTISFNPDPATADAILQSIAAEYSLSLTDIAAQHNTTIEVLTAWLTREDIDERLSAIESACARRARLTAANHLPAVAHVAKQALEEASDVLRLPPDYRTHHSIALRIRATESARRAAALLLRIANFIPGPRRVRQHAEPASPRITPPPALTSVPHAEIEPTTSPSAPHTESTQVSPAAAPHTESTPSATTDAVTTDRVLSAPTDASHTDRAQPAPLVSQRFEPTSPLMSPPRAPISAPFTQSELTVSSSEPAAASSHSAPASSPRTKTTPTAPYAGPRSEPATSVGRLSDPAMGPSGAGTPDEPGQPVGPLSAVPTSCVNQPSRPTSASTAEPAISETFAGLLSPHGTSMRSRGKPPSLSGPRHEFARDDPSAPPRPRSARAQSSSRTRPVEAEAPASV